MVPLRLMLAWPKLFAACPPQERTLDGLSILQAEGQITSALANQGFAVANTSPITALRQGVAPGFAPPATVMLAERGLKIDKTRSKRLRRQTVLLLIVGLAFIGAIVAVIAIGVALPGLVLIALVLPTGFILGAALLRYSNADFWSEIAFVLFGSTAPAPGGVDQGMNAPGHFTVRVWAGVARSQNWAARSASGRAIKQVFGSPSLDAAVRSVLASLADGRLFDYAQAPARSAAALQGAPTPYPAQAYAQTPAPTAPYWLPTQAPAAPPPPPLGPPCPRCSQPATYVAQYGRWYCVRDQSYL